MTTVNAKIAKLASEFALEKMVEMSKGLYTKDDIMMEILKNNSGSTAKVFKKLLIIGYTTIENVVNEAK